MKGLYEKLIVALVAILVFIMVFSPHFDYPFPYHQDEWHHISEAKHIQEGDYEWSAASYRVGFQAFLSTLPFNLVKWYAFLPALWAVFTSLVLFFIMKKLTNSFLVSVFSMVLFASLRTNSNLLGIWFFVPLTFCIPFVYIYTYLLHSAFAEKDVNKLVYAILIMVALLFFHALSVLFIIPTILVMIIIHWKFILEKWQWFLGLLAVPVAGILFFWSVNKGAFLQTISNLFNQLIFTKGWGVQEINNSLFEVFSLTGYILAAVGIYYLWKNKKWLYVIWPITILFAIIFYKIFDFSILVPFQRNMYYFAIAMPILASFGVLFIEDELKKKFKKKYYNYLIPVLLVITVLLFWNYHNVPEEVELYKVTGGSDIELMIYMQTLPKGKVLIHPVLGVSLYPISGQTPAFTMYFNNLHDRQYYIDFIEGDCSVKNEILQKLDIDYVYSEKELACGWKLLKEVRGKYLYGVNNLIN